MPPWGGWAAFAAPVLSEWSWILGASPLLSLLLVYPLISNSYTEGKVGFQASFRPILHKSNIRSEKYYLPPLSHFLTNQSYIWICTQWEIELGRRDFNPRSWGLYYSNSV